MIIRNQRQWQYLKRLAEMEKIPHALLVSGLSAAEFISRVFGSYFTEKPHPDFLLMEPQGGEIKISQVRECLWRLSLKPSLASSKVAVIDQAHLMNHQAQSALLKTLEEPKGKTLLILITEYPDLLFPTILSRVQTIKLHPSKREEKASKESRQEILELVRSDLATRFQYVEKIYKSPELKEILTEWMHYFRGDIIKNKELLQKLQKIFFLLTRTNVNPRLALETLMLEVR